MAKYKIGDKVQSKYRSPGCAPAGSICKVLEVFPAHSQTGTDLYGILGPDNETYRNYEDELLPYEIGCDYCLKGKSFNTIYFGDVTIRSYILGDRLSTDVSDEEFPGEEDGKQEKITHCPFCGHPVHEEPDEEIEIEEKE